MSALGRWICIALLFCLSAGCLANQALGADRLQGIHFGMSPDAVHRWIKKQPGSADVLFIKSICRIPLGLDFMHGLSIMSSETGIVMYKALNYPPFYFYKDKLVGYRKDIVYLDEFLHLKKQYPAGRYINYDFPSIHADRTVFLAQEDGKYVFTNEMFDLYVFDAAARKQILQQVAGSGCWLAKQTSPRLPSYVDEYEMCVAKNEVSARLLWQDLSRCRRYCRQQHELFFSPECPSICDEAYVMGKLAGS